MSYREPPLDTVLRHLSRAADVARKRRVPMVLRRWINTALLCALDLAKEQRNAKGRVKR